MTPLISSRRQRGIALPAMMIVLVIMLISGAYLLKSSNSTTMTTANLAYQSVLNRANDRALMEGSEWLASTWSSNRVALDSDSPTNGYVATLDTTQNVHTANFWNGKKTFTDDQGNVIEYVIHRLCSQALAYNEPTNQCMQTTPNTVSLGSTVALGASLSSNALQLAGNPQLHYIITARINGLRGGNVISQLAVLIGV
jgi:Tfp pilus assembly protein PilX